MKITFLGTSHGVPAADRFCSCAMLESGGAFYLIDAGAPAMDLILRQGKHPDNLRALFTTHVHGDHAAGAISLIDLMNWYYKNSSADFYFTEEAVIPAIENLLHAFNSPKLETERLRLHCVDPAVPYEDENIRVEYFPTCHIPGHPTYSLLVTEGKTRVLFSGDLSGGLRAGDVPAIVAEEELDAFVCEMAHFGMSELAPYLDTCRAKRVFFNHVFPLTKYDDIEATKKNYSFEILCPKDGDSFVIGE